MVRHKIRLLAPAAVMGALCGGLLSGCGLGETAATTAAMAEAKAQEVKAAKETQARFEKRLDEANATAAKQREDAEKLTE